MNDDRPCKKGNGNIIFLCRPSHSDKVASHLTLVTNKSRLLSLKGQCRYFDEGVQR